MNGHERKEYGKHEYPKPMGIGECKHGCGCHMEHFRSSGPAGLDPSYDGLCPGNPTDRKPLGGTKDYEEVVRQRIDELTARAETAEREYKAVEPGAKKLARELARTEARLEEVESTLRQIREVLKPSGRPRAVFSLGKPKPQKPRGKRKK